MSAAADCSKARQNGRGRPGGYLFEVIAFVQRAGAVAHQRRELLRLEDSALKDFGASRALVGPAEGLLDVRAAPGADVDEVPLDGRCCRHDR
jgi:hypothetical protein